MMTGRSQTAVPRAHLKRRRHLHIGKTDIGGMTIRAERKLDKESTMAAQNITHQTEECPECKGTGVISAQNCSSCNATGEIIVHSHTHRHGPQEHDHPHHHTEPHHPDDDTEHTHDH
jgi:RecJ-like exonuclease